MRQRFLKEAPEQWRTYMAHAANWQGSVYYRSMRGDSIIEEQFYVLKRGLNAMLRIKENRILSGRLAQEQRLVAYNESYAFELQKARHGGSWLLTGVFPLKEAETVMAEPNEFAGWLQRLCVTPACVTALVNSTLDDKSFLIDRVIEEAASTGRVRVDFSYEPTPSKYPIQLSSGSFALDPEHYWVLVSGKIILSSTQSEPIQTVTKTFSFEYDFSMDPPIPKALTVRHVNDTTSVETISFYSFDLSEGITPEEEFRLSHFGLLEPRLSITITPWWLYMILSGLALVALGLAIYAYRRWRLQRTFAA